MRALTFAIAVLALAGCEKLARNMHDQPRYKPMRESRLFPDGTSARAPVPGTLAASSGVLAGSSSGRGGAQIELARAKAESASANPYPVTMALLHRGQERYTIYCAPCHSPVGDGDGMVPRRGFPHPPSFWPLPPPPGGWRLRLPRLTRHWVTDPASSTCGKRGLSGVWSRSA